MQQKFTQEADFRQERDFGQKISASFEFIGAHWRPLGKCLAYFVLPAALLMGLAMGVAQSELFGAGPVERDRSGLSGTFGATQALFGPAYFLGMAASMIGYVLLSASVYGYLRARLELPAEEPVTPRMVGQYVARYAPALLLSSLVVGLVVVLGFMLLFVPGVYLMIALSLVWAVQVLESGGIGYSLRRSMNLLSGHWWSTFGLLIVMSIIIGMLGIVFQIPQYVAIAAKSLHLPLISADIVMIVGSVISAVGGMLLYVPVFLALSFQYFNLVEKKDGLGLRQMISSLGTTPAPTVQNAAFRPDDEGEY